jgi:hypothetical protein
MFGRKHPKEVSFFGVAIGVIFVGAALFSLGVVGWFFNYFSPFQQVGYPMLKVLTGIIIIALGYIIVELEWMRREK